MVWAEHQQRRFGFRGSESTHDLFDRGLRMPGSWACTPTLGDYIMQQLPGHAEGRDVRNFHTHGGLKCTAISISFL